MTERDAGSAGNPDQKPEQAQSDEASKGKPAPKRKRRKWPWIVGGIVLLLVILVALLPTILSSSVGRSIVESEVNSRINGKLQIQDWSLGWFSGISVDGLVINDESNRQILQLPHFSTRLGLLSAIRGKYNIGQTRIEGLDVLVSREADGSLNWAHLSKSSEGEQPNNAPKTPEPEKKEPAKETKKETKLPDV